jgi:hypothetical protein
MTEGQAAKDKEAAHLFCGECFRHAGRGNAGIVDQHVNPPGLIENTFDSAIH